MNNRFGFYLQAITNVVTIFALIFGIYVFFGAHKLDKERQRTVASLEFVSEYGLGEIAKSRSSIHWFWSKNHAFIDFQRQTPISDDVFSNFLRNKFISNKELIYEFTNIVFFYEPLNYCVIENICDKKIVFDFFCPFSVEIVNVYDFVIVQMRRLDSEYGDGIIQFSDACRKTAKG